MMDRRQFLLSSFSAAAAVSVPAYVLPAEAATKEMGLAFPFTRAMGAGGKMDMLLGVVERSAAKNLPPLTRYEVRITDGFTDDADLGLVRRLAWHHHPAMASDPDWGNAEPNWMVRGGNKYGLLEQRVTPADRRLAGVRNCETVSGQRVDRHRYTLEEQSEVRRKIQEARRECARDFSWAPPEMPRA